jgi:hypothetical protein
MKLSQQEEERIKDAIGDLCLIVKRSETADPCLLCRFEGIHSKCPPGIFETVRIRKTDYYILICRLKLLNYIERTLRRGYWAKIILLLIELIKQKRKPS